MNKAIWASVGLLIGVIVGQISMIVAMEPTEIMDEAYKLAGHSYRYGCVSHSGKDEECLKEGREYEDKLRKALPIY